MTFYANETRETLRRTWYEAWRKKCQHLPLQPLELQIVDVIDAHPEYQPLVESPHRLEQDFATAAGQDNPFLHMGLHLALQEQLRTDRPAGITAIYARLRSAGNGHEAQHRMIEVLAATLWNAQTNHTTPDERAYLAQLRAL